MVGHRHELGEGGVAEDGIVGQADVRDVEIDQLGAVVGLRAKGDYVQARFGEMIMGSRTSA